MKRIFRNIILHFSKEHVENKINCCNNCIHLYTIEKLSDNVFCDRGCGGEDGDNKEAPHLYEEGECPMFENKYLDIVK